MIKINQYSWDPEKDLIAAGAFAEVFRATDDHSGRYVALKVYKEAVAKGTTTGTEGKKKYTLEKEFETVNGLSHTNLITYFGLNYLEGTDQLGRKSSYPVIVMELAPLGTLTDFMKTNPSPEIVEKLIKEIIAGVGYLHEEGIIHRDLKPGNILISQNRKGQPVAKITDFGISKDVLTEHTIEQSYTEGVGTPHYMAPEQFYKKKFGLNGEISERTDLWALGVIVYTMMKGTRPFGAKSKDYELIREQIVNLNPDISGLDDKSLALVQSTLYKNAADRVGSAEELLDIYRSGKFQAKETAEEAKAKVKSDEPQTVVNPSNDSEEEPELATAVMDQSKKAPPKRASTSAGTQGNKAKDRGAKQKPVQKKSNTGIIITVLLIVIVGAAVVIGMPGLFGDEDTKRYKDLVEQGDDFMNENQLDSAQARYDSAQVIKPEEAEIKDKLAELDKTRQYNGIIASADKLLESNKIADAIAKYKEAQALKPSTALENKISGLETDMQFNSLIAEGDRLLASNNKDGAIGKYQEAGKLKPNDETVGIKISNANAQQANKDLLAGINNGNAAMMRKGLNGGAKLTNDRNYIKSVIDKNCTECVTLLANNGYNVRQTFRAGSFTMNGIGYAAFRGKLAMVRHLNANYFDVDARAQNDELTPLMFAINDNHMQTSRYLLQSGADANATARDGISVMDLAETNAASDLLIEFGADPIENSFGAFDDYSDEKKSWTKVREYMVYEGKSEGFSYPYSLEYELDPNDGFEANVNVEWSEGSETHGFGLIFASKSTENYYAFVISNNGGYAIFHYDDDGWNNIQDWVTKSSISKNTEHNLKVVSNGVTIDFYIDDKIIQTKRASEFDIGKRFGMWSAGYVKKVFFSDFVVYDEYE